MSNQCSLTVNEEIIVDKKTPEHIDRYLLKRLPNHNLIKNFEISLKVKLNLEKSSDSLPFYKTLMMERVQSCIDRVSSKILSQSGDVIKIKIFNILDGLDILRSSLRVKSVLFSEGDSQGVKGDMYYDGLRSSKLKDEISKKIPTREVLVFSGNYARPFENWNINYSCPVIIHELMHFFGLEDEYSSKKYSCRSVGPSDSLMRNSYLAFRVSGIPLSLEDYYWYVNWNCKKKE